jgi:hypothetical protein
MPDDDTKRRKRISALDHFALSTGVELLVIAKRASASRPGLFNLGNTVRNAQNTQNKVLGEPKTSLAFSGGWVDCAHLASLSWRQILAADARASITMAPKRKNPFCNTHEHDYGLKIMGRNTTTAAVESVACRFCTVYGREEEGGRKWRATANVKNFAAPFRMDHYKSHTRTRSALRNIAALQETARRRPCPCRFRF